MKKGMKEVWRGREHETLAVWRTLKDAGLHPWRGHGNTPRVDRLLVPEREYEAALAAVAE